MLVEGVIASVPDADRRVTVTIPTFHPDQTFGPCPYMPRGGALPTVGARCLVALDETGIHEPWVPAWDGPDGAVGGAVDAVPKTLVDAKGDLLVGSANDTVARLGTGSNGQVLTADSAQALGVKWATAPSAPANGTWVDVGSSGAPSFGAGYSSHSSAHKPQVMKDANGFVHGRGLAIGPGSSATFLSLPAGWRPGSIPTIQATGALRGGVETTEPIDVDTNIVFLRKGTISSSSDWVSLGGLLFLAEA